MAARHLRDGRRSRPRGQRSLALRNTAAPLGLRQRAKAGVREAFPRGAWSRTQGPRVLGGHHANKDGGTRPSSRDRRARPRVLPGGPGALSRRPCPAREPPASQHPCRPGPCADPAPVSQLSTVIDMLEGALYGLDLLKLHSVTTRLVGRVDKLEEVRGGLGPRLPGKPKCVRLPTEVSREAQFPSRWPVLVLIPDHAKRVGTREA